MGADLNFDANNVPPTSPFTPLPNGKYTMAIVESEVKPTANGAGKYLQLTLQVLDGDHKGKKVWERLNIVNNSKEAQDIAQRQLSAICHATGVMKLSNSSQLHDKPMLVRVVVKQDVGFEPKNEVKGYEALSGATPPASTSTAAAAPSAPPQAANVPAWAKKAS
jgi:hypothetical protein